MLALTLSTDEVRNFMNRLLREDIFDTLSARAVELHTKYRMAIETTGESWAVLRPLVTTLIKSTAKPQGMKIIFTHPEPSQLHPNAAAMSLNLAYENESVTFITATAQKEFALDKSIDSAWDEWIMTFFSEKGIEVMEKE